MDFPKLPRKLYFRKEYLFGLVIMFLAVFYILVMQPPAGFPERSIVTVSEGKGLMELAEDLKEENVLRSTFWFRIAAIILGGERGMQAGQYYLSEAESPIKLAWRVVRGDYQLETVKLTIPEGFNVKKISALFDEKFPFFDNEYFELTAPEGYLFPDTYFFQVSATATSTVRLMRDHFIRQIFPLMGDIETSDRTLEQIVTMASILEGEAKTQVDREIVSGILWKRLKMGMALQVDATFSYVNGKTTKELTLDDLKIDSPYNTYMRTGLPPSPISNPGLEALRAAVHPTTTPYLYFLTADDGTMHYSRTFDEHVTKKLKYLSR